MKNLILRAIGKMQESWHQQAIHTYMERLKPFASIQVIELPEGHQGSAKPNEVKTKETEGESLLKGIPKEAWVVALDETGRELDSSSLAAALADWGGNGRPLVFLIGGSWGLSRAVKERADAVLSLGRITLPHALARIVLMEQLYRAAMINTGKTYHK
jgi:23S rRNA (pseudouridine1915-N3)-methyltransferase